MAKLDDQQDGCHLELSEEAVMKVSSQLETEIARPLVYKLVRLEDDGTFVPASDDEVMEVDSFYEGAPGKQLRNKAYQNEKAIHPCKQKISQDLKNSGDFGAQNVQNLELERKKLLLQLELLDSVLAKLKNEEHIHADIEKSVPFPEIACADAWEIVDGVSSKNRLSEDTNHCIFRRETLSGAKSSHIEFPLQEKLPYKDDGDLESPSSASKQSWNSSTCELASRSGLKQKDITCSPPMPNTVRRQNHNHSSDASLENLSIKKLQEAFQCTFGRKTSVKDKQWLKRRITLGLKSTQNVESRVLVDGDKKKNLSNSSVRPEMSSPAEQPQTALALIGNHSEEFIFDDKGISCQGGQLLLPSPSAGNSGGNSDPSDHKGHLQIVPYTGSKRQRKPTKRYIEELSVRDAKVTNTKPFHVKEPVKSNRDVKYSAKTASSDWEAESAHLHLAVTGVKFTTGFRGQRGRPRKISSIAVYDTWSTEGSSASTHEGGPSDMEVFHASNQNPSDALVEIIPTSNGGMRRKHHRPWTIQEVMKLIEGVACCGVGKWAEIKKFAFPNTIYRTSVDLKDKWRNLLRASNSHLHSTKQVEQHRKHLPPSIPMHILVQVQQLAGTNSQQQRADKISILSRSGRTVH